MNLDADVRSLQSGEYRKLTNGITVPPASSSYANALRGVLHSLFGNAVVSYSLPGGTNTCVGFLEDRAGNRAFYFVANSTAANNSIYQYSNGSITLVLRSAYLDFVSTDFIDSDIVGDILTFTNARTDIYKINITKAIAGATYTPLLAEILLIKPMPQLPVTWALSYDNSISTNLLYGNYFQFYYRYIYEDYDYSVFSPCSTTTNSWELPTGTAVRLVSGRANITLSGIQTIDGVSATAGSRVLVISQTDPLENGIWVTAAGAWSRAADFPAGSTSDTTVYVTGGLIYYFNTVWRISSLNPGTIASYAQQKQGPNRITITRPATPPATVIGIQYAVRINGTNELTVYREERDSFSGSHTFYNDSFLFTVPDSEAFVWNDSIPLKSESLMYRNNRIFLFNNTEGFTHETTTSVALTTSEITAPTTKVYNAAKAGGRYNVGIVFKDFAGRHSGVKCDSSITIPEYGYSTGSNRYEIVVDTSGCGADIPSWATHFSIVSSRLTNFFITQTTIDVYYFKKASDGTYTYSKTLSGFQADGTFIDISSLTKINKGYAFTQGDRIKIHGSIYSITGSSIIDVEILGQVGNFVQVRVLNELLLSTTLNSTYYFEIYTPQTLTAEPFYELGKTYAIGSFGGSITLEGDVEILNCVFYRDSSGYSATDPFANTYEPSDVALITYEAMNAWDRNYTIWVTQSGRSLVRGESRQLLKKGYLRFGQAFILNSNYLGLNTFYALDEYALRIENGAGTILADGGDVLVAINEIETTSVYIGEGFVSTADSNEFLAKTDSVIGDDRKLLGGHGCIHKASVVSRDSRVYFLDARKGVIVRRSQDGLTVISEYGVRGLVSTLCTAHKALGSSSRIVAGWDPQYDCYVISFIDTSGPSGYTLYFHEKSNAWVCLTDERPELWGILEQKKIGFLDGALWLQSIETNYNNWFGTQYNRRLEFEISPMQSVVHLWDAIEVDVPSIYSTAGTNEDVVLLYHQNGGSLQTKINYADFQLKELVYRSSFFRYLYDVNYPVITDSKYKSPHQVRGQSAFLVITYNGTDKNVMKSITVFYTPSMNSSP